MEVVSVNIGRAEPLAHAKASGMTGIFKRPVEGPVQVTRLGLLGDAIVDVKNHGGVDQAVYIYTVPDYEWWSGELGYDLAAGTFGENLTVSNLESAGVGIGDRFHIGEVLLEVTAPRIPCVTLARRMEDAAFLKRFRAAERPGCYCRVLKEGTIQAGDAVRHEVREGETLTILDLFRDWFTPHHDVATLRRHLEAPIAIRDRVAKEQELRELLGQ